MTTHELTREQVQVHLALQGWVPVELRHKMTYWGAYHEQRGFWFEDVSHTWMGPTRAPLKWVEHYDHNGRGKEIRWDQMPVLVLGKLSHAIEGQRNVEP